jgi:hypothetical protein
VKVRGGNRKDWEEIIIEFWSGEFRKNIKKVLDDKKRLLPLPPRNETDRSQARESGEKERRREGVVKGKNRRSSLTF